jgi:precorrin-6B methylase 2
MPSEAELVRAFHDRSIERDDCALEAALHIRPGETPFDLVGLLHRFGNQNFTFAPAGFAEIREIFRCLRPRKHDIVCDVGAGHGHFVLYGACLYGCRFRAIEIMPARCRRIATSARKLGLSNIELFQTDALAHDYAQASYIFVNSPFFPEASREFVARLAGSAARAVTVVAMNNIVDAFRRSASFVEIRHDAAIPQYRFGIFRRRAGGRKQPTSATPAGSAPPRPRRTRRTAGAAQTAATSARDDTARR